MGQSIARVNDVAKPIAYCENTGIDVYGSYEAKSGFNYLVGVRQLQGLYIVEQIADGTGCTFLCGIKILCANSKELIKEIEVKNGVRYSRLRTLELVKAGLLEILEEAAILEGHSFNYEQANKLITEQLDNCYFEQSRKAILNWAKSIGIL